MFCCVTNLELNDILELFFATTQLPILAITPEAIHGCSNFCTSLAKREISQFSPEEPFLGEVDITTPNGEKARLYVLPICPCAKKPGLFILGPYLATPNASSKLTYRPAPAWPYLIAFLRKLQGLERSRTRNRQGSGAFCLPIRRAKRIIHKHYDQEITLESTARRLGLNKSYLSTLFKAETGQTFTEYVHQVRVEESKKLLAQTSWSILDIALQVGFSSQNYFSRTFKKLTGITPSEFRKQTWQDAPKF